jgi:hypothetical protein
MSKIIFKNILNYYNNYDSYLTYFYKINYPNNFDYETNKYRNNYLFNFNHSRFYKDNTRLEFDPLIYTNEVQQWPDFIKYIYYTDNTMDKKLVQLSYLTNLYLNICFSKQNYCSLHRIGYYMIYDIISTNQSEIDPYDFFKAYIKQNNLNFHNTDVFYSDKIQNMINFKYRPIIKYPINDIQPTNWAYKNFFDYIPICHIPYDHLTLITNNICYHKANCHDSLCKTHNNNNLYMAHLHYDLQSYYDALKVIDIDKLSTFKYDI